MQPVRLRQTWKQEHAGVEEQQQHWRQCKYEEKEKIQAGLGQVLATQEGHISLAEDVEVWQHVDMLICVKRIYPVSFGEVALSLNTTKKKKAVTGRRETAMYILGPVASGTADTGEGDWWGIATHTDIHTTGPV